MFFAGASGLVTTMLGIVLVFFPAQQITSLCPTNYDVGGTLFFVGLAAFFFFVYGRHKDLKGRSFSRTVHEPKLKRL